MRFPQYFLSCDWGTSNFRLKLVETKTFKVLKEIRTQKGIKKLYCKYKQQNKLNQFEFFSNYLISQVNLFPKNHRNHIILVSGMASSNIGMYELEYASFPFGSINKSLVSKKMSLKEGKTMILISGVRNRYGMMRGEETQAIGLESFFHQYGDGILLLPGTHSKHLTYKNGVFTDLKTFMTGELFEIISKHSILSNSINSPKKDVFSVNQFVEGVELGIKKKFSSSLFSIRANHISGKTDEIDNYYFLSGLLIGEELSYLQNIEDNLYLASPEQTNNLYVMALEHLGIKNQYIRFDMESIEKSLLIGQQKILSTYYE